METKNFNQMMGNESQTNAAETLPRPRMIFMEAVKACFAKYATFSGRARRSEYWWFSLFETILFLIPVAGMVIASLFNGKNFPEDFTFGGAVVVALCAVVMLLILFVLLIPSLSVTTRRLHDVGRSGWWIVASYAASCVSAIMESAFVDKFFTADVCTCAGFCEGVVNAFQASPVGATLTLLVYLVEYGLAITIFVFTLFNSHKGENKYGLSPKYQ